MLSFLQYLTEVERDVERAEKLGTYLAQRHGKRFKHKEPMIRFTNFNPIHRAFSHNLARNLEAERPFDPNKKPQTLAIKDLIPTQAATRFKPGPMARWKMTADEPIHVLRKLGKNYVLGGHHNMMGKRLIGKKEIKAQVYGEDD